MDDSDQLDGLFMTALQKSQGIGGFFDNMFGFLYRKSDYFADTGNAWTFVETSFKKYQKKFNDRKEKEAKKKKREEEEKKSSQENFNIKKPATVKEITPEEYEKKKQAEKLKQEKDEQQEQQIETKKTKGKDGKDKEEDDGTKLAEGHIMPGAGNGSKTDKYSWTQNDIKEITINIPVPSQTKGKDIVFKYDAKNLFIGIKDQEPIINGEMFALIKPDTLVWALDEVKDGKLITVSFEKFNNMNWWDNCIKGEGVPIDTRKINPEATRISDIDDPEMRGKMEQLMFDTQQKAQGLPTSEQLKGMDGMGSFMKAHPEMDFSKCKFN